MLFSFPPFQPISVNGMAIMNSASLRRFQGTRVRLVRQSDRTEFDGWVVETETELVTAIAGSLPTLGESLEIQLGSQTGSCAFSAKISRIEGNRCAFPWPALIRLGGPQPEARRKPTTLTGTIKGSRSPVQVLDLAPSGIGISSDLKFEPGDSIALNLTTEFGGLALSGSVIYCQEEGSTFRSGIQLANLGRLDQARWDQILAA